MYALEGLTANSGRGSLKAALSAAQSIENEDSLVAWFLHEHNRNLMEECLRGLELQMSALNLALSTAAHGDGRIVRQQVMAIGWKQRKLQFDRLAAALKSEGCPEKEVNLCLEVEDLQELQRLHGMKRRELAKKEAKAQGTRDDTN